MRTTQLPDWCSRPWTGAIFDWNLPADESCAHSPLVKFQTGDKVYKTKGYPFRGTVLASFFKLDGKELCVVEIEPGPNAAGLVYIHPPDVLEKIELVP